MVRAPVRLCQRAGASCAACCGIYNRPDAGRAAVRAELARHTRLLARTPRTPEAFRDAARQLAAEAPEAIFPSIRACMLVGYLDAQETRIGCLAHPKVTGGTDLRACGVYDVETCESFLCPSHAVLTEREAAIAERATDPILYGLVVTDATWLRAVLAGVAAEAGAPIEPGELDDGPFAAALRRLLALKEELAPGSEGRFGAFRHGDGDDHPEAAASAGEAIVAALGADERSGNDPERLTLEAERRLAACAGALARARAARRRK